MGSESVPPLRIRENDGSPNVIPVYDIILSSNLTLINKGGGIVSISATTGAGGTSQDPITFPLIVGSGGTGQTTLTTRGVLIGSGINAVQVLAALNSGELLVGSSTLVAPQILPLSAGSQGFVLTADSASRFGVSWMASGGAGSSVVYSATGNKYVVMDLAADLTAEHRLVQSGNSITIATAAGLITINAVTNPVTNTASLVQSSRTISTTYPLSGGGDLSLDRTFAITTGALGQILITSANALGDLAWVNTLGGASSVVYSATGNNYVVMNLAGDLTNEYRLVQSGNSITITTGANTIVINAVTNGGGGTKIVDIPMALMSVEVNSANAFWNATGGGSLNIFDDAYITFIDSGRGRAVWWLKVPRNVNDTPAWNIIVDSKRRTNVGVDTGLILSVDAITIAHGESSFNVGSTVLVSAGTFKIQSSGILTVSTMSATDFDGTLTTSAMDLVKVQLTRHGNADGLQTDWDVYSVNFRCTIDT